jgi:hypothetical protein
MTRNISLAVGFAFAFTVPLFGQTPSLNDELRKFEAPVRQLGGSVRSSDQYGEKHIVVDFQSSKVNADVLGKVRKLVELASNPIYLNLNNNASLGDEALAVLDGWTTLRGLGVGEINLTKTGIAHIATLKGLQWLYIAKKGEAITLADIRPLSQLKELQVVSVYCKGVTEEGYGVFADCVELREISINGKEMGDIGLKHIGKLVHLEEVQVKASRTTDAGWQTLPKLTGLKRLLIWGTGYDKPPYKPESLLSIGQLANLESLELSNVHEFSKVGERILPKLQKLTKLATYNTGTITAAEAAIAAKLPKLDIVKLIYADDATIAALAESKSLRFLTVDRGPMTDACLMPLQKTTTLVALDISRQSKITPAGLKSLQDALPKLKIEK